MWYRLSPVSVAAARIQSDEEMCLGVSYMGGDDRAHEVTTVSPPTRFIKHRERQCGLLDQLFNRHI